MQNFDVSSITGNATRFAKSMMDFRFNTLPQAKKTAAKSLSGRNVSLGI
jgi:trehalose/maltose hydrolase-like predicted phosphorylase